MEELINKVKEFTQDGPPGVGQRIELGDLAKKAGVKRTELEKLIDKAIVNRGSLLSPSVAADAQELQIKEERLENRLFDRPVEESFRVTEYERPDMDAARVSFEKELILRKQQEQEKVDERADEIEQPEVVFPKLDVTFGREESKEEVKEEVPKVEDIEVPEIVQEELKSEFEVPEIPISKVEVKVEESEPTDKTPAVEEQPIDLSNHAITFEPTFENQNPTLQEEEEVDFSFTENDEVKPTFAQSIKNTQERLDKEDILRKIIAENKDAREKAQEEEDAAAFAKKKRQTKVSNRANSKADAVTLEQSKAAKVTGIVSIVASILPFYFIGLVAGVYGYNVAKKHKENIESNPSIYGSVITNNVKLGYFLSIGGMIIGTLRLLTAFF